MNDEVDEQPSRSAGEQSRDRRIHLFSGLALQRVVETILLPRFRRDAGAEVEATFEPSAVLERMIRDGARPDVLVAVRSTVEVLSRDGVLNPRFSRPLVRSGLGIAVAAGAPRPAVDDEEAFVETLLRSRVAYSRTGASGAAFRDLLARLGIAERVESRAVILDGGYTAEALLDRRADLAVQQMSELASVRGVDVVGPFPESAQSYVELDIGIAQGAPPSAEALAAVLRSEEAVSAYAAVGMEFCASR